MIIRLRRKYLAGFKSTQRGGEKPAPKKHRTKLNDAAKRSLPPQPVVVLVVDGATGKGVFVKQ